MISGGSLASARADRFHHADLADLFGQQRVDHVRDEHRAEDERQKPERAEDEEECILYGEFGWHGSGV